VGSEMCIRDRIQRSGIYTAENSVKGATSVLKN